MQDWPIKERFTTKKIREDPRYVLIMLDHQIRFNEVTLERISKSGESEATMMFHYCLIEAIMTRAALKRFMNNQISLEETCRTFQIYYFLKGPNDSDSSGWGQTSGKSKPWGDPASTSPTITIGTQPWITNTSTWLIDFHHAIFFLMHPIMNYTTAQSCLSFVSYLSTCSSLRDHFYLEGSLGTQNPNVTVAYYVTQPPISTRLWTIPNPTHQPQPTRPS